MSTERQHFKYGPNPTLKAIIDNMDNPGEVKKVVIMKGTTVGKTTQILEGFIEPKGTPCQ